MSRKQILARVYIETAPWHSIDGWFCDRCGTDCGASEDTFCGCCQQALTLVASDLSGGDIQ